MTIQQLPQDPREVQLKPGYLADTPGVQVSTEHGQIFITADSIPDVRRRLGVLNDRIRASQQPNPAPRTRKATSK